MTRGVWVAPVAVATAVAIMAVDSGGSSVSTITVTRVAA